MKPKAEIMAKLRKDRAAKGLVELRLWLTPEQKERVRRCVSSVRRVKRANLSALLGNNTTEGRRNGTKIRSTLQRFRA